MTSILQKARDEGRAQAKAEYADYASQLSLCRYDDAREEGRQQAWAEAPSRFKWLAFGVLCGAATSILIWQGGLWA